jgi:Glycosyl hydrolases family 2, sugar binding domain/Glycosyl hydrolases family 2/Glycosyl hydrolases family 2, TIM barrel domain
MNRITYLLLCFLWGSVVTFAQDSITLPEHPRPDFERSLWKNLNGKWAFEFDAKDRGIVEKWMLGQKKFSRSINVPFPWGSALSGVKDEADIAWYQRSINVSPSWKGRKIFLLIGASDWETSVYLDGKLIGKHQGGYTPSEYDLTPHVLYGKAQRLNIRVDDKRREFTLYGKQGYGNARGIWQTIYLEARGQNHLQYLHFTPDIDAGKVTVKGELNAAPSQSLPFKLNIEGPGAPKDWSNSIPAGQKQFSFEIPIPNARLWRLEDPFLYQVKANVGEGSTNDQVSTYFGMRKISVMDLPGTQYPYIALNNEPIYLQLTLDQSYHPEGFYTFPTDQFMKEEVLRAKQIGLNGIRTHIKVEVPRKLYWADRLGVLVMADLPNSWGPPEPNAQGESEATLRAMIQRDFNHPAIFSWIVFNETWGLRTKVVENGVEHHRYLPETQKWVASMYRLTKSLDPSRLAEDNSICCGAGHTETDINSWHEYLPGWAWEDYLANINNKTFVGSEHHFEKGYVQARQPNINSECGNVWGYNGSTGDVDYSWDYHRMMNTFRKYPKVAGWLYTEHHDVINEWNGYWKFDRSNKFTGLEEMLPGMSLNDFHAPFYISTGNDISRSVKPGQEVKVPLFASFFSNRTDLGSELTLKIKLSGVDALGLPKTWSESSRSVPYRPWLQKALDSLSLKMPNEKAVVHLSLVLQDQAGNELHHNIMHFVVENPNMSQVSLPNGQKAQWISLGPKQFSAAQWSLKQWNVLDGLKVNGAGSGYFEYRFPWPKGQMVNGATFVAELGAKQLFAKDREGALKTDLNYMLGAKADPSQNVNSYPMTDETLFPSSVQVYANGTFAQQVALPDDPADHRGVLSWHYQPRERKLNEAGSYGYRVAVNIPKAAIEAASKSGELVLRLEVSDALPGGLAVYGERFGRFGINPGIVVY